MKLKTLTALVSLAVVATVSVANAAGTGNNEVYIIQTDRNYAEANQDCGATGCNNIAGITQVYSDYNGAPGAQNNAVINQFTSDNRGYVTQQGNNNSADIAQRESGYADIRQIDAYDSSATINQDRDPVDGTVAGADNTAGVYQSGIAQVALIKQFGDSNQAYAVQTGDSNYTKIIQNKGSVGEYADVIQDGWGNTADVVMNGQGDTVWLGQSGMKNNFDVDVAATADGSVIKAMQVGSFNDAKLYTQGTGSMTQGSQNDTQNYAEVVQLGNTQNVEYVQDGVENNAFIGQYETATNSLGVVRQSGSNHSAAIYQHCPDSTASITQHGVGAVAVIRQQ